MVTRKQELDQILTKEFLIEEYSKNGKSAIEIAKNVDCGHRAIYNRLRLFNIPIRKGNTYDYICSGYKQFSITILSKYNCENGYKSKLSSWICKCACGKEFVATTTSINKGLKSCGCYRKKKKNHRWKGTGDIPKEYFSKIKYRALQRGIKFNVTIEYLWDLFLEQKGKCYFTNHKIDFSTKNISLDRIDSDKGYEKNNVAWVLKEINFMKHDMSKERFIELCQLVCKNWEYK